MRMIENRTFAEINVGDSARLERRLTRADIELFAVMSGDVNPAHLDDEFAAHDMFHHVVAHGMWGGALISAVLGTRLPGPGTIYLGQTLRFRHPIAIDDTVTVLVTVREKVEARHQLLLDCRAANQADVTLIEGEAQVIAPTEKIVVPAPRLPKVTLSVADDVPFSTG